MLLILVQSVQSLILVQSVQCGHALVTRLRFADVYIGADWQRWADSEFVEFESSSVPIKLNPIQSWSAKCLKIIIPIQSWSANVKSCIFILPHQAKKLLELFCHQTNTTSWRQNSSSSAFFSWGKVDTAFWHFQNLTMKCLLGIRGKNTAGVILPLGESDWFD